MHLHEIPNELDDPKFLPQIWEELHYQENLLTKHTKMKHVGFPVEECHTCGHYAQEIIMIKEAINTLNKLVSN